MGIYTDMFIYCLLISTICFCVYDCKPAPFLVDSRDGLFKNITDMGMIHIKIGNNGSPKELRLENDNKLPQEVDVVANARQVPVKYAPLSTIKSTFRQAKSYYDILRMFLKVPWSNRKIREYLYHRENSVSTFPEKMYAFGDGLGDDGYGLMHSDSRYPIQGKGAEEIYKLIKKDSDFIQKHKCGSPTIQAVKVIERKKSPYEWYLPACVLVHRCLHKAGCCEDRGGLRHECGPTAKESFKKYFFVLNLNPKNLSTAAIQPKQFVQFSFVNHTKCGCIPVKNDDKHCKKCPNPFRRNRDFSNVCRCDCSKKNKLCHAVKNGNRYLPEDSVKCIKKNRCELPKCRYGKYILKDALCPPRPVPNGYLTQSSGDGATIDSNIKTDDSSVTSLDILVKSEGLIEADKDDGYWPTTKKEAKVTYREKGNKKRRNKKKLDLKNNDIAKLQTFPPSKQQAETSGIIYRIPKHLRKEILNRYPIKNNYA